MTKFRLISLEVGHVSVGNVPSWRKVVEPSEKLNTLIFNQVLRQVKLEPIQLAYKEKKWEASQATFYNRGLKLPQTWIMSFPKLYQVWTKWYRRPRSWVGFNLYRNVLELYASKITQALNKIEQEIVTPYLPKRKTTTQLSEVLR